MKTPIELAIEWGETLISDWESMKNKDTKHMIEGEVMLVKNTIIPMLKKLLPAEIKMQKDFFETGVNDALVVDCGERVDIENQFRRVLENYKNL